MLELYLAARDAKYKRISVMGIKHPDLYQLLAYTIATELPGGLLVYAAGEGEAAVHEIVNVGKRLEVTSIDPSGTPKEILGEIARIATTVKRLRDQVNSALRLPVTSSA